MYIHIINNSSGGGDGKYLLTKAPPEQKHRGQIQFFSINMKNELNR